jgi:glutathione S-transferase
MLRLIHYRLCPLSRSIRLALAEQGREADLVEEHAWEWPESLLELNPSGELPVLQLGDGRAVSGTYAIAELLSEEEPEHRMGRSSFPLFPGSRVERAEVRRLVHWFNSKFDREVSRELLAEKVYPRLASPAVGLDGRAPPGPPDPALLRAVRHNLRYHLTYIAYLAEERRWLAGEEPSYADLAAAAHLSLVDYLGEISWDSHPGAKAWYQRVKSRPSFRHLLADRVPGFPPPHHYADLDF